MNILNCVNGGGGVGHFRESSPRLYERSIVFRYIHTSVGMLTMPLWLEYILHKID